MTEQTTLRPIVIDSAGGEYMESVLIVRWSAEPGTAVKAGETVVTVETAKAATEVAAEHDGYLAEIIYGAGSEAPVGSVLGYISDTPVKAGAIRTAPPGESETVEPSRPTAGSGRSRIVASPYARRVAAERNIELATLSGTGPAGRIKSRDVPIARPALAKNTRPPIVFLHGFGADQSIWRWIAPLLRVENPLIMLDLPGHGSSKAPLPSSIQEIAEYLSTEIAEQDIQDAHVIGHSLGGAVALALSAVGCLRIHSLGLIATAGLGSEIDVEFLSGILAAQTPDALQPWLEHMVASPASLPANLAGAVLWQRHAAGQDVERLQLASALFPVQAQRENYLSNLKAIRVPAKIIWGKSDKIIPVAHAMMAPGTVGLHLLDNIGHVPQLECPDIVARLIDELVMSTGR